MTQTQPASATATTKLRAAFREALGLPPDTDFESLKYRGVPEWDSVAHMQLVNELETAFDIMLPTEDVIALSSFVEARRILGKHGVEFAA